MDRTELLRENIRPILLGDNACSRAISRKLYFRYGILSCVCDCRRSFFSFFRFCSLFRRVSSSVYPSLLLEQIEYLASFEPYCVYVIVPCSDEYQAFVKDKLSSLDKKFLISDPDGLPSLFSLFAPKDEKTL